MKLVQSESFKKQAKRSKLTSIEPWKIEIRDILCLIAISNMIDSCNNCNKDESEMKRKLGKRYHLLIPLPVVT